MFFHGPAWKKHFQQLIIHAHQVLADKLQWRLVALRRYQDGFVNLANSLPHVHLQLPVPVGLLFRVGVLLLQGFHSGSNIVPVFLERKAQSVIFTGFSGAPCFFKLRISQFSEQLGLLNPARFSIKPHLKIGQTLRLTCRQHHKKNGQAE